MNKLDITKIPVYYINLNEDTDRRKSMEKMFKDNGFINVTRFPALKLDNKRNSISASHMAVLKMIRDSGVPALVFEDDAIVENFKSNIEFPQDADAVYLGKSARGLDTIAAGLVKRKSKDSTVTKIDKDLYRIDSMYAAHAILYLSKEYVDFCIRVCKTAMRLNVPHDVYLGLSQPFYNIYGYKNSLFAQTSVIRWTTGAIDNYTPYGKG
jgi:GR25 family glycosyltransferase involved in LPS biosynthesis